MFSDPTHNIQQFTIEEGEKVADIGSGSGFYAMALAKAVGQTGKVFAVDVQKDLLERLRNGAHQSGLFNIEAVWGDVEKIGGTKLREASVSKAVIANILFQVKEKQNLILEIKRILRPGGKALLIDWSDSFGGTGPQREDVVTKESAKELFKKQGFTFDREISAGEHHYGIVFTRT